MSYDPIASRLVLLKQVSALEQGQKVRFLGCVNECYESEGILVLIDKYPVSSATAKVRVNYDNVDDVESVCLSIGAWVNILGYVRQVKASSTRSRKKLVIDAVRIWSAGAVNLDDYQNAVLGLQQANSQ